MEFGGLGGSCLLIEVEASGLVVTYQLTLVQCFEHFTLKLIGHIAASWVDVDGLDVAGDQAISASHVLSLEV